MKCVVMAILVLAGGFLPDVPARGQEKEPALVLVSRTVEVEIHENLAMVRVTYKVKNVGGRVQEGTVEFRVPPGAAVCEATLLKQIARNERRSKVLTADRAAGLYSAVVRRSLDPAIVDLEKEDRYRLRFFPVQPGDDQTASVLFAFEVPRDEVAHVFKLPLAHETNFRRLKGTRDRLDVSFRSSVENARSSTHELGGKIDLTDGDDLFVLRYDLGSASTPVDFKRKVDWSKQTARRDRAIRPEDAALAVLGKRDLDAGVDASARRQIRESIGVVSKDASLLVVDRATAEEVGFDLFAEDAARCDLIRSFMGQPSLKRSRPCERFEETTLTPRSSGRFDVSKTERVRHAYGCPVKATSLDALRLAAAEFAR